MRNFLNYWSEFTNSIASWYLHVEVALQALDPSKHGGMIYTHCFLAEICGIMGIIYLLVYALLARKHWTNEEFQKSIWAGLCMVLLTMILALTLTETSYYTHEFYNLLCYYPINRFSTHPLLLLGKYLLLILTICTIKIHQQYFETLSKNWEYSIVILLLTIVMLLTISSNDLFTAFMVLEVQSLSLYVFLSFRKNSSTAMEASMKYFIFTAFSGASLIFGISILYAIMGTLNLRELHFLMINANLEAEISPLLIVGCLLILSALFIKLTLVPLQWWVGDVYQGSFNFVNSYISIVTKIPVIFLLIKISDLCLSPIAEHWLMAFQIIALSSIAYGTFYSLTEYNFKRFWAYSSVSHMGYILITIFSTPQGLVNSVIYLIIYLFSNIFVWAVVLHLRKLHIENLEFKDFFITIFEFTSIRKWNKKLSFMFSLMILSLAGMPIGLGFLPKALIIYDLYVTNSHFFYIILIIINVISFAYYLRLMRFMSFNVNPNNKLIMPVFPRIISWMLVLVFMLNIFFFFFFAIEILEIIVQKSVFF